ncbi:uncharacterized protein BCR38DRAFT_450791, partial [Pseudomassariella vexata]
MMDSYMNTPSPSPPSGGRAPHQRHKPQQTSLGSLYDALADMDETQLDYLIQEMNHTAPQNFAVSQAVSAFEAENPTHSLKEARKSMLPPTMERQPSSKSLRGKLRVQTMFRKSSLRHSQQPQPQPQRMSSQANSTKSESDHDGHSASTVQTPPSGPKRTPTYRRIERPDFKLPPGITIGDLLLLLQAEFMISASNSQHLSPSPSSRPEFSLSPSPVTPSSPGRIRRHRSKLDLALEAERSASGAEEIALGMLEPRPLTPACRASSSARDSPVTSMLDMGILSDMPPPAPSMLMEGIFEVLDN